MQNDWPVKSGKTKAELDQLLTHFAGRCFDLFKGCMTEQLMMEAVVMANARQLIRARKSTLNVALYKVLFGTGFSTARERCARLGLEPDSNETSLGLMLEHIKNG